MNSVTRLADWNAFTWIVVLFWVAFALYSNFTWPIDRTVMLRQFKETLEDVEKHQPDLANSLKNIRIVVRSGYPITYIVRDEYSNPISFSFYTLFFNLLVCFLSTVSAAIVSQQCLHRYSVRFLLIATPIIALVFALDQFGHSLFSILFVFPVFVTIALFVRALLIKRKMQSNGMQTKHSVERFDLR